jgi:hypothetical protein
VAAVDEGVADGDSAMTLDQEQDVVRRLPPGEGLDSEGSRSPAENSCAVIRIPVPPSSGGGANTCARRVSERLGASRSCHGFVRTMTVSRSAATSTIGAGGGGIL